MICSSSVLRSSTPVTGFCWDLSFSQPMLAGQYTLVLSQDGNSPLGDWVDGYLQAGVHNYTAQFGASPGDLAARFIDVTGTQRGGHWAVDIEAPSLLVPEPASLALMLGGSGLIAWRARRR